MKINKLPIALLSVWVSTSVILVILWLGNIGKPIEITTAECPTLRTEVIQNLVSMDEGYRCERREGSRTDLLQPSGYWVNDIFSCWKMEMTADEWCKTNPCSRNNPND
jgi:hypothetical protein